MNRIRSFALACAALLALPAIAAQPWSSVALISNGSASGSLVEWMGGDGVFMAEGTFGGTTVTLEFIGPDGTTLVAVGTGTTCAALCASKFSLPHCFIKAVVAGGSPSALYVAAEPLH